MNERKYIVGLLDRDNKIKFPQECKDGPAIVAAVRLLCQLINWDPLEHYEDFYETLIDPTRLDSGEVAFIDLFESNLIAAIVVIGEDFKAEFLKNMAVLWERSEDE